jgi:hypothetical protein
VDEVIVRLLPSRQSFLLRGQQSGPSKAGGDIDEAIGCPTGDTRT